MLNHFMSKQFFIFLLSGSIALSANFGSRIFYNNSFDFSVSIILAYFTGMLTAFILGKLFVFKESRQTFWRSVMYFILVNLIGLLQTWIISLALANYILPALSVKVYIREIAHGIGLIFPVFTTYIGHKYWTFR